MLLANMSTAFAIDSDSNRIEDVTEHPEILQMVKQGKFVSFYSFINVYLLVPSDYEVFAPW